MTKSTETVCTSNHILQGERLSKLERNPLSKYMEILQNLLKTVREADNKLDELLDTLEDNENKQERAALEDMSWKLQEFAESLKRELEWADYYPQLKNEIEAEAFY